MSAQDIDMVSRRTKTSRRHPARRRAPRYSLRLFVAGQTPKSIHAIENLKRICERHLPGQYDLEVVDLYQQPELARVHQIVVAPTLVKERPEPLRILIGDLSNQERVLLGLGLSSHGS